MLKEIVKANRMLKAKSYSGKLDIGYKLDLITSKPYKSGMTGARDDLWAEAIIRLDSPALAKSLYELFKGWHDFSNNISDEDRDILMEIMTDLFFVDQKDKLLNIDGLEKDLKLINDSGLFDDKIKYGDSQEYPFGKFVTNMVDYRTVRIKVWTYIYKGNAKIDNLIPLTELKKMLDYVEKFG